MPGPISDSCKGITGKQRLIPRWMECICKELPDPECWQWQHHWENRDTEGAFTSAQFEEAERKTR